MSGLILQNLRTILSSNSCSFSESSKTEMEWTSLSRGCSQTLKLHANKKFEKDTQGFWVWYKNQVLPTFKIQLLPGFDSVSASSAKAADLSRYVALKCFAVFSNNQI